MSQPIRWTSIASVCVYLLLRPSQETTPCPHPFNHTILQNQSQLSLDTWVRSKTSQLPLNCLPTLNILHLLCLKIQLPIQQRKKNQLHSKRCTKTLSSPLLQTQGNSRLQYMTLLFMLTLYPLDYQSAYLRVY